VQTTRSNDVQKRSHSSGDHQRIQVSHLNQSINQSFDKWLIDKWLDSLQKNKKIEIIMKYRVKTV